jgi:Bacterial Ig-like domain/NPCBM/NEW2 domain
VKRFDSGTMTGATASQNLNVPLAGVNVLSLVVTDAGDGNDSDHGDWANAQVSCTSELTPPTVTAVTPLNAATNQALTVSATATFSESMNVSTLTTTTFTLVPQGSSTPLPASVSYDAGTNTVTLDPTANLVLNTTYTATIKGGSSGAKDAAGNPLGTDKVWTFSTGGAPTATISQPLSTFKFKVGDVITYSGSATDPEDGAIPAANLHWDIVLYHCPGGSCHTHPFVSSNGSTGNFTAPDHGDESYFQIVLTATDSGGVTGTTNVSIMPQTVQLTLATSVPGLQVVYGGTSATSPSTYTTIVGSTHTIYSPSPQGGLSFINWSDGGAQQHNVVVGATNVTFTATFADTMAPTVTTISPADGATSVAQAANTTAVFSEQMNPGTLTTTTVTLMTQGSTTPLAAAVTYNAATNTVTLNPTVDMPHTTTFTATVKGGASGAKDAAGTPLAADKVWSFTTVDLTPPTVTTVSPAQGATGVARGANVTAVFSEPMLASSITTATVTLVRQGTTTPINAAVTYNATTRTVTLNPSGNLAGGALYTATINGGSTGVKDAAGNPLTTNKVWTFTTQ